MQAWLDVTAGVAGDMVMGALVDAGADLDGVQAAIRAVVGDGIVVRREEVVRAGQRATKIHVDVVARGAGSWSAVELRAAIADAGLHPVTEARALRTLELLLGAYRRGHDLASDEVALQEVAALDVLADIVGDCEALRLLGIDTVTASPVALGSGRIRTSHGDLSVPVPAVADLVRGWPSRNPGEPANGSELASPGGATTTGGPATLGGAANPGHAANPDEPTTATEPAPADPHPLRGQADRYVPLGGISGDEGTITEGPAQVVGAGLGELATPTGMALLRSLALTYEPSPANPVRIGVGAGGRDVPGRANVVRVLLVEQATPRS